MSNDTHQKLVEIAKSKSMPEIYCSDIEMDLGILNKFTDKSFVWVLRDSGTTLLPLGIGVDPGYLVPYADQQSKSKTTKIFFYHIDFNGDVKLIDHKEALSLINKKPSFLGASTIEEIIDQTNAVLSFGKDFGIWGIFNKPKFEIRDWKSWHKFFRSAGNQPMTEFLDEAFAKTSRNAA